MEVVASMLLPLKYFVKSGNIFSRGTVLGLNYLSLFWTCLITYMKPKQL